MKKILFAVTAVASIGAFAAVPFKIGIAGFTFHKKNVDQTIAAMKELDLHSLCVKDFHLKLDCTQEEADAFKAKLAEADIVPVGVGPIYADTEELARKGFEQAKKLGVRVVVGVPFEYAEIDGKKTRVESDKMLDIVDRLVKEYDMVYAIHNHGPDIPYLFPTGQTSWNMVKDLDPRMGLCLDIGHDFRAKANPADSIRQFHTRIYDMHVKNVKFDPVKNLARPMPRGDMNMWEIVKALVEVGYDGVCSLEYESFPPKGEKPGIKLDEVAESVGYFKGLMKAVEG